MAIFAQNSNAAPVQPATPSLAEVPTPSAVNTSANQYSMIGKSIVIKGEIVASDPIYVYGTVEGSINAPAHRVTIGKEGIVKADINAREIVIMGDVCGNLESTERVEIRNDGSLMGNLSTRRIYIEEGAVLSGVIEVHKPSKKEKAEQEDAGVDRKGVVSFPVTEMVEEIAS
jgi:cytoskeletal protein CcmA (bactofilin family)